MSVFYQVLLWFALFAFLSYIFPVKRNEFVLGVRTVRYEWLWAFIGTWPLLYYTATRSSKIGDTGAYMQMFEDLPSIVSNIPSYLQTIEKDKGFYILSSLIKSFGVSEVKTYFFIIALLQVLILVSVYRKYSTDYLLTFFLFIASTDYISWMFNGIRQFLAVSFCFLTFTLILKKKYIPAIVIILLASTVHGTALLMLPFIFIAQGNAWNKKTMLYIILVIVAVVFVDQFTNILDNMLQDTQYENVVSDWMEWQDDGTNPIRVLVYSVPTILSLIGLRHIRSANDPVINLCVNMSIVATGLYLVSMVTSGIFIGRLPIYFSLYSYILLPWEIDHLFTKDSATLMKITTIGAYIAFYVYSIQTG